MENRILILYNPRAGKGLFPAQLSNVIDLFVKAGFKVEVYPTQAPEDGMKYVRDLEGNYSMIVAAGGDGTLDEVFTGLIRGNKNIPIGYIPVGSTNDYATSIGISSNINEAVGGIIAGQPRGVDVGIFNKDHVFVYVAAFGAFTQVAYETNQDMKNALGHVAYLLEGARRLGDLKSYPMYVTVNGRAFKQEYIYGMVTNSISVGGMKNLTGKADDIMLDDGLFEVTLIRSPRNLIELQEIVSALLSGNRDTEYIDNFVTDSIKLESDDEIPWTMDGEYGGSHRQVVIENHQRRLSLVLEDHGESLSDTNETED